MKSILLTICVSVSHFAAYQARTAPEKIVAPAEVVANVSFSPDSTKVIGTSSSGATSCWSVPEGKLLWKRDDIKATLGTFNKGGDLICFGGRDKRSFARTLDIQTGRWKSEVDVGDDGLEMVATSPSGLILAVTNSKGLVSFINLESGKVVSGYC